MKSKIEIKKKNNTIHPKICTTQVTQRRNKKTTTQYKETNDPIDKETQLKHRHKFDIMALSREDLRGVRFFLDICVEFIIKCARKKRIHADHHNLKPYIYSTNLWLYFQLSSLSSYANVRWCS